MKYEVVTIAPQWHDGTATRHTVCDFDAYLIGWDKPLTFDQVQELCGPFLSGSVDIEAFIFRSAGKRDVISLKVQYFRDDLFKPSRG